MKKFLKFFQQKMVAFFSYVVSFNVLLTKDIIIFKQLGLDLLNLAPDSAFYPDFHNLVT